MDLLCISLMINNVEHHYIYLLPIGYLFFFHEVPFQSLAHLSIGYHFIVDL